MIARELSVQYGPISIGGSSRFYKLDGFHRVNVGYDTSSVEITFTIVGTDHPEFVAAVQAAENALRTPYLDFSIRQGASKLLDLSHTNSTGFNAMPEIVKRGGPKDTGRSRQYVARITFGMPADTGEEESEGLRESSVDVAYTPSRRKIVTITGIYTAITTTAARDQYDAEADTYCSSVLSDIGGDYELAEEPRVETDQKDKLCRWTRVYEQLIFAQSSSATDDAAIVRQDLRIERRRNEPGDTTTTYSGDGEPSIGGGGTDSVDATTRIVEVLATYNAWINATQTTDLSGKYENTIKDWIIDQVKLLQDGSLALVEENLELIKDDNRISASLLFHVLPGGEGAIIEREITTDDREQPGDVLVPVWSGNRLSKYHYEGPATFRRTVTLRLVEPGIKSISYGAHKVISAMEEMQAQGPLVSAGSTQGAQWVTMDRSAVTIPKVRGMDGYEFAVTEMKGFEVRELFVPHRSTGSASTPGAVGAVTRRG